MTTTFATLVRGARIIGEGIERAQDYHASRQNLHTIAEMDQVLEDLKTLRQQAQEIRDGLARS